MSEWFGLKRRRGETIVKAWSYHGKRRPCHSALTGPQAVRQSRGEGTALSGVSVVVTQDAAEALPTLPFADETPDLSARVDEAIGSRPGWRSGVQDGDQEFPGLEDEVHGGPDVDVGTSIASGLEDGLSSA
jgi:hypothetical protein